MANKGSEPHETDLQEVRDEGAVGEQKRKGGRVVAGKDLSNTRSSNRKGRKSSSSKKKLEEQGE